MLQLQNLSKSYAGRVLFEQIQIKLPAGKRLALIGQNGTGKTTLLNIFSGIEQQDGGEVIVPKDCSIGYLPQEANPRPEPTVLAECEAGAKRLSALKIVLDETVHALQDDHSPQILKRYEEAESAFRLAGGYSLTARATQILGGLGFTTTSLNQYPLELSGGFRMRIELAKIFLDLPDLLLLDEPTNHLDLPSLVWVESWLRQYKGTVIFVSHDRGLLNRLPDGILHLHSRQLQFYTGNFDQFLNQRDQHLAQLSAQKKNLARRVDDHQKFVDRFGAKASKAKQAQSRIKMIAKLRSLESGLPEIDDEKSMAIPLPSIPPCGRQVLKVEQLTVGYQADHPLVNKVSFELERGHKIAIIGANGIGKSTLIKTLTGQLAPLGGSFTWGHQVTPAYFAQDQAATLNAQETLLYHVLQSSTAISELMARKLLGALLFSNSDVFKNAGVLSGGEKNRLGLACLLAQNANLLLMDEPTNHLDMTSVEVLVDALNRYQGTVLFVSHDRDFIDQLATHVLVILADGRSELFLGGLEDYQRLAASRGFPNVLDQNLERASSPTPHPKSEVNEQAPSPARSETEIKNLQKEKQKAVKKLNQLESDQEACQIQIKDLEASILKLDPLDYQKAQTIHAQIEQERLHLVGNEEAQLELWQRLEEINEVLDKLGRG